jgi:hypothetical protein
VARLDAGLLGPHAALRALRRVPPPESRATWAIRHNAAGRRPDRRRAPRRRGAPGRCGRPTRPACPPRWTCTPPTFWPSRVASPRPPPPPRRCTMVMPSAGRGWPWTWRRCALLRAVIPRGPPGGPVPRGLRRGHWLPAGPGRLWAGRRSVGGRGGRRRGVRAELRSTTRAGWWRRPEMLDVKANLKEP